MCSRGKVNKHNNNNKQQTNTRTFRPICLFFKVKSKALLVLQVPHLIHTKAQTPTAKKKKNKYIDEPKLPL